MGVLKIEKIGGIGGFGLPNSRVKSEGQQAISALSAADQATVETLFNHPESHQGSGQAPHEFRWRLTRTTNGKDQKVEVADSAVPAALKACVSDKIVPP